MPQLKQDRISKISGKTSFLASVLVLFFSAWHIWFDRLRDCNSWCCGSWLVFLNIVIFYFFSTTFKSFNVENERTWYSNLLPNSNNWFLELAVHSTSCAINEKVILNPRALLAPQRGSELKIILRSGKLFLYSTDHDWYNIKYY